jgi:hypothetical protein
MAAPEQRVDLPCAAPALLARATLWAIVVFATLAIGASMIVALGLAFVLAIPLLWGAGGAMCTVWAARRRRQALEGRDASDVKGPTHAGRTWPVRGITDDRLPEP